MIQPDDARSVVVRRCVLIDDHENSQSITRVVSVHRFLERPSVVVSPFQVREGLLEGRSAYVLELDRMLSGTLSSSRT